MHVLWIPEPTAEWAKSLDIPLETHEDKNYISLRNSFEGPEKGGAVIYAPGSGHLFESRRKTIGMFLLKFGMNVIVFNYTGTGRSQGKITEKAMYDDIEAAYKHLKDEGFADAKILSYGHCTGSGPASELSHRHPQLNLLLDRCPPTMGEFAELRVRTELQLPYSLRFLTSWVEPIMKRCFHFNNREKVKSVQGSVATMRATREHLIPEAYLDDLYRHATAAKVRMQLVMEGNHDNDLAPTKACQQQLGQFLAAAGLSS